MKLKGLLVDDETRCEHYHSELDIIAIKFKCCGIFYPCYECHTACEDHPAEQWERAEFEEKAIICGNCKELLTISEYLNTDTCPHCKAKFNPKCSNHYHLYFKL